jgi:hypothetical protein
MIHATTASSPAFEGNVAIRAGDEVNGSHDELSISKFETMR